MKKLKGARRIKVKRVNTLGAYEAMADVPKRVVYLGKDASKGALEHEMYHIMRNHPKKPRSPVTYMKQELAAELYARKKSGSSNRIKGRLKGWANDVMWRRYKNSPQRAAVAIDKAVKSSRVPDRWGKDWAEVRAEMKKL